MARSLDIAEFNLADGSTPSQAAKLNHNFRALIRRIAEVADVAEDIDGSGGDVPQAIADYVIESGSENGWTWRKWLSGLAECWMDYDLYVSSWNNWGNVYESAQPVPATAFPSGLFTATPAPNVSLRNSSTGAGIMGFETTGGAGSSATSMPLYLTRATSTGAATFQLRVEFFGKWQ